MKLSPRLAKLFKQVRAFPRTSGVYIMKNAAGREIYVGKAKELRTRVRQYFDLNRLDGKTSALMSDVAEIETLDTPSEVEALLLESRLIKDLQPKYNVSLKGTSYPLVEITWGEPFPRVFVTRDRSDRKSHYVGPFVDATGLRAALGLLRRVFRFCTCTTVGGRQWAVGGSKQPTANRHRSAAYRLPPTAYQRPCLDYYVGRCSGPCGGRIGTDEYRATMRRFEALLKGRGRSVLEREISARMKAASKALRYEEAARLRDELNAVRSLALRGGLDSPQPPEVPRFDPAAALSDLAHELDLAAPPHRIEGLDLANLSGREAAGSIVTFLDGRPAKGFYRRYRIKLAPTDDDYAMMREVVGRRCRRLAEEATAEMKPPMHADIRRYAEPQEESNSNIGVHRRASAVSKRSSPSAGGPDLLLLDGGAGHLAAGLAALKRCPKAGRPGAVCSLSKGDETIHLPGGKALHLPRTSPALKILQHVRDEAHRFAGQYHRKLRDKRTLPDAGRSSLRS